MQGISTQTHGLIDYVTGAAISMLPGFFKCGPKATAIFEAAGIGASAYSMLTDYERGMIRVIPMEAHLAMDAVSGMGLMAASLLLKDEKPQVRCLMGCVGLFEVMAAAKTQTKPRNEQRRDRATAT